MAPPLSSDWQIGSPLKDAPSSVNGVTTPQSLHGSIYIKASCQRISINFSRILTLSCSYQLHLSRIAQIVRKSVVGEDEMRRAQDAKSFIFIHILKFNFSCHSLRVDNVYPNWKATAKSNVSDRRAFNE